MPNYNALPLELLAEEFAKLPGIGLKSAQRLAYYMISRPEEDVQAFADAMLHAKHDIHYCPRCQNLTDLELCSICSDEERDGSTICVVESPKDVSALERTGEYTGLYHVLHGLISPIDGVTPDKLRIRELLARLKKDAIREVIMATNPTVEGDATAMYLAQLLEPLGVKVTRLAFGLPVGGMLEYADEVTLFKALENRTAM